MGKIRRWILGWMLRFGMALYFFVLAAFCAAALLKGQYWMAVVEICVTLFAFLMYILSRRHRHEKYRKYMDSLPKDLKEEDKIPVHKIDPPLPVALVRLNDGVIMSCNDQFKGFAGYSGDLVDQRLEDLMPDFDMDWLNSGHEVCTNVVSVNGRRYRIYGVFAVADDYWGTHLGLLLLHELLMDLHQHPRDDKGLPHLEKFNIRRPLIPHLMISCFLHETDQVRRTDLPVHVDHAAIDFE